MKIFCWNVNGIRAVERKGELQSLLTTYDPTVLVMQETKAKKEQLSKFLTENENYHQYYHSAEKAGYSGTSIWFKKDSNYQIEDFITGMLPHHEKDSEGRVARIDFTYNKTKYSILGIYFPNGGKSEEAFEGKLIFYQQFLEYVNDIQLSQQRQCIWAGDVNCAHNEIDLARPNENKNSIGFLPVERQWLDQVIEENWVDVYREKFPEEVIYSWWNMKTRARDRNVGWRIDYFFLYRDFFKQKEFKIIYHNEKFGSDHCPVSLEFYIE